MPDDRPFIVLTETKFSLRCIQVWIGTLLTGLVGPGAAEVLCFLPVAAEVLPVLLAAFLFAGARLRFAPAAAGMVWREYRQQVRPRAWVLAYSAPRSLVAKTQHTTGLYTGIRPPRDTQARITSRADLTGSASKVGCFGTPGLRFYARIEY